MAFSADKIDEHVAWQDVTEGLQIHEPATSKGFMTGQWRTNTPVWLKDKCKIGRAHV